MEYITLLQKSAGNSRALKLISSDLKHLATVSRRAGTRAKFHPCSPPSQREQPLYGPISSERAPRTYKGASRVETLPNNYQAMEAILRKPMTQRYGIFKRHRRA